MDTAIGIVPPMVAFVGEVWLGVVLKAVDPAVVVEINAKEELGPVAVIAQEGFFVIGQLILARAVVILIEVVDEIVILVPARKDLDIGTGLNGARAYVGQREALQGVEDPPGSGRYPEPRWLGMIQHDMMLWDHGAPGPDGRVSRDQRPEADVNIEFQSNAELATEAMELAFFFKAANEQYATDYPATVGPHMTNTDSTPFMHLTPAISLRENERGAQVGAGWNPNWHQPTDVWTTYTDDDFRLGLNAAQTTLAAIAQLVGATVER